MSLSVSGGGGPRPRGGTVRPPVSFRGGGVSVPTGHTGPAHVPVRGSIQVVRAPRRRFVLLSTACPTSLASDQTKGGGRPGVQRTPRFGAREQRFDLTKIQLSSKLSPKDPKEFAKKFRDATGEPREKRLLQITNLKATLQRLHRLYIYHTEKRSGRSA